MTLSGNWALAADRVQWILQCRYATKGQPAWRPVSFVSSTKDILARCMREKGVPAEDARRMLDGLPSTFQKWRQGRATGCIERVSEAATVPVASGEAEAALCASERSAP
jgi:hypothetical protein